MATAVLSHTTASYGSFRKIVSNVSWYVAAFGAATRVAAAVRSHQRPASADLTILGIDPTTFPKSL